MVKITLIAAVLLLAVPARAEKLMVFGGLDHKTYLGCLSCNEFEYDSVFNKYGPHGSAFGFESIFNHYSEYGSKYSMYSACAEVAFDPPVVVDKKGSFYGRLTLAPRGDAIKVERITAWLAAVCED